MFILSLLACSNYLTPGEVRDYIDEPSGGVSESSMGRVADDYFDAQQGMSAQSLAFFVKSDAGDDSSASKTAAMMGMPAVQGATAGDVFCATNLVLQIAQFDACDRGNDCEVDLTIDSCILALGDDGDLNANGKLHFNLYEETGSEFDRGTMELEFKNWEYTLENGHIDHTDGILGFEYTDYLDGTLSEMAMSIDIQRAIVDPAEDTLFSNGRVWEHRSTAAVMASFAETEDGEKAELEFVAFTGEDDERDEWVVLGFAYEEAWASDTEATAEASMSVTGSNGSFECVWSADFSGEGSTSSYASNGTCTDENGDTFTWDNTMVVEE